MKTEANQQKEDYTVITDIEDNVLVFEYNTNG
jgi:hypothetical protein